MILIKHGHGSNGLGRARNPRRSAPFADGQLIGDGA